MLEPSLKSRVLENIMVFSYGKIDLMKKKKKEKKKKKKAISRKSFSLYKVIKEGVLSRLIRNKCQKYNECS